MVVVIAIATVLAIGLPIADAAARAYVTDRIATTLRSGLGLDPAAPLDVEVGGGSMLVQLASGRLDRVDVASDRVTLGELTGAATLTASGVPIDDTQPVERLLIDFAVDESELENISQNLSGVPITSVDIVDDEIVVGGELTVFGFSVPLGVGVVPTAVDGELAFTPGSIEVADATFDADELRSRFGQLAESALATQNLCVAEYLPSAFTLDDATLRGSDLILRFTGDGAVLGGSGLTERGSCAT